MKVFDALVCVSCVVIWENGDLAGGFFLFFFGNLLLSVSGSILVVYWEPAAAGSGIPEVKSYLNGTRVPKAFNIRTLIAKVIGVICSVASSLPVSLKGWTISFFYLFMSISTLNLSLSHLSVLDYMHAIFCRVFPLYVYIFVCQCLFFPHLGKNSLALVSFSPLLYLFFSSSCLLPFHCLAIYFTFSSSLFFSLFGME